jgi:hypothetical protein
VLETGRGLLRGSRAALATLLVLGLSVSAHTLGGGAPPGLMASVVLALLVGPVAWWCARRRLGPVRLVALLGGAQVAVHLALSAMAPMSGAASPAHVHGGLPAALGPASGAAAHAHQTPDASMFLAHVVATLLTALVLARAENVLWRVVTLLLPRPLGRPAIPVEARTALAPVLVVLSGRAPRPLGGRAPPVALA